ncbi:MAG: hypothetical protein AB7V13_29525, partial [Pseudorhodoplanes sp.]
VVCMECGNTAHCFRRMPQGSAELQSFNSATCGRETTELRGEEASDYQVEKDAERIAGVGDATEEKLDRSRRRPAYRRWLRDKFAKTDRAPEANQCSDQSPGRTAAHPRAKD